MAVKRKKNQGISLAWMMIFTDLVALLLTFFVMLFSMSVLRVDTYKKAVNALTNTFDVAKIRPAEKPVAQFNIDSIIRKPAIDLDYLAAVIEQKIKKDELIKNSPIIYMDDKLVISLLGDLLFAEGSAQLNDKARQALFLLGGVLQNIKNTVSVSGYSDETQFENGTFTSDWELSLARAIAVANELKRAGYTEKILSVGFGKSRSSALKGLPESKKKTMSRRVDVMILSTSGKL
ncbi:MAG: chemotaxis protein MotB [Rhodospirillaceae bacterium]|nr:chemotaxis protein MotB [Rhodospirillaceae bacterium]|tara:strand:- start:569 stop:1270 length:702 start_codon:yes stop_codon:yes gene_type:complete